MFRKLSGGLYSTKSLFSRKKINSKLHSIFVLLFRYRCFKVVSIISSTASTSMNELKVFFSISFSLLVIVEIAHTSRNYSELSGRTQPVIGDVVVSLINLGISLKGITAYAKRDSRPTIPAPQPVNTQKQLSLLQAGTKLSHPPHIPNHMPDLPDPHAYIRTPVSIFANDVLIKS